MCNVTLQANTVCDVQMTGACALFFPYKDFYLCLHWLQETIHSTYDTFFCRMYLQAKGILTAALNN